MYKIVHYRQKCIGCGICYEAQPELWRMSKKDGKATLVNAVSRQDIFVLRVNIKSRRSMELIAEACPVKIIKVL